MTRKQILDRHQRTLKGTLRAGHVTSRTLGIRKPYYVYEPPGWATLPALPVVYLFRGHEREWVNLKEDSSRTLSTAIEDLDRAITLGMIPPVLAVMPGLNSSNNHVPSLGINMAGTWAPALKGLGTGQFWDFLITELLPTVARKYPRASGIKVAAGFSLGGYTVSLLASKCPGLFKHVGIYDGLFMWPGHRDPRIRPAAPGNDRVWLQNGLFDAAFANPRDMQALNRWNPTDAILRADPKKLALLRKTTWWISCASADGQQGNLDRSAYYKELIQEHGIPTGFEKLVFNPAARHSWHWADRFLIRFLQATLKDPAPRDHAPAGR